MNGILFATVNRFFMAVEYQFHYSTKSERKEEILMFNIDLSLTQVSGKNPASFVR